MIQQPDHLYPNETLSVKKDKFNQRLTEHFTLLLSRFLKWAR